MKKEMLKRSLALSALMLFIITGNAMAERSIINGNVVTSNQDITLTETDVNGAVQASNGYKVNISGGSTIDSKIFVGLNSRTKGEAYLGSEEESRSNYTINSTCDSGARAIQASGSIVKIIGDDVTINAQAKDGLGLGVALLSESNLNINASNVYISGDTVSNGASGIYNSGSDVIVNASNSLSLSSSSTSGWAYTVANYGNTKLAADSISIASSSEDMGDIVGALSSGEGVLDIKSSNLSVDVSAANGQSIGIWSLQGGEINIESDVLNVRSESPNAMGIHVQNNTEDSVAPDDAASITINADKINVNSSYLGLSAFSNGQMNINGNLTVTAPHAIDVRGNSTININTDGEHSTVLNGDIVFETPNAPGDSQNSGKIINAYVNVNLNGEDSSWTGRAYQAYRQQNDDGSYSGIESVELEQDPYHGNVTGFNLVISDGAVWEMTGDSFVNNVNLQDGGVINVQDGVKTFNADELALNDGVVNLQGTSEQSANISKLSGQAGTVTVASEKTGMKITESNSISSLTVAATSNYAEALASNDMAASAQKVANQVIDETATTSTQSAATDVYIPETAVTGVYTAKVEDGLVVSGHEAVNSTNKAISEMANHNLMVWRLENNDMNKRLGELRDSKGEHGVWVRMTRGEGKYKSIKNQYNAYQLGYDEKLSADKSWTLGAAFTYTDGETTFATGSGENKHKGFAVYGSKLNKDGSFIDLIAKYSRLDNEFKAVAGIGKGEYENNGYSVSAEYGKRFTKDNGFWIEPQVELTYGKVGSASYVTSKGVLAQQDGMESLVGRIGFAAGKNFKRGNAYLRASYLYDFDGDTKVTYSNASAARSIEDDLGGGWFEVGIGSNVNLSEATHLYVDIEKTYGGDVAVPWQWNVGLRYSF